MGVAWLTYSGLLLMITRHFLNPVAGGQFSRGILTNMEEQMFEVTETAVTNLTEYLSQNKIESPVRVALMQGG